MDRGPISQTLPKEPSKVQRNTYIVQGSYLKPINNKQLLTNSTKRV